MKRCCDERSIVKNWRRVGILFMVCSLFLVGVVEGDIEKLES